MPFKWKRTWPTTYVLKATRFAAELKESRPRLQISANKRGQFFQILEYVIGFLLVLTRIDKTAVGNRSDAHPGGLSRSHSGKRVLNHKASFSRDSQVFGRAQVNVGRGFTVFHLFACNNDLEESG